MSEAKTPQNDDEQIIDSPLQDSQQQQTQPGPEELARRTHHQTTPSVSNRQDRIAATRRGGAPDGGPTQRLRGMQSVSGHVRKCNPTASSECTDPAEQAFLRKVLAERARCLAEQEAEEETAAAPTTSRGQAEPGNKNDESSVEKTVRIIEILASLGQDGGMAKEARVPVNDQISKRRAVKSPLSTVKNDDAAEVQEFERSQSVQIQSELMTPGAFAISPNNDQEEEMNVESPSFVSRGDDGELEYEGDLFLPDTACDNRNSSTVSYEEAAVSAEHPEVAPQQSAPFEAVLVADDDDSCRAAANKDNSMMNTDDNVGMESGSTAVTAIIGDIEEAKVIVEHGRQMLVSTRILSVITFLLIVVVIFMVMGIAGVFQSNDKEITLVNPLLLSRTIRRIQEEGILRCLHLEPMNYSVPGLETALCHAIAAALEVNVDYIQSNTSDSRLLDLHEGRLDLLAGGQMDTMDRQVYLELTPQEDMKASLTPAGIVAAAFSFSTPYIYGGLHVAGDPFYVDCAEQDFLHVNECKDLRVCVYKGSYHEDILLDYLPVRRIVALEDYGNALESGVLGRDCNVIAMEGLCLADLWARQAARNGADIKIGTKRYAKSPIALVTRSNDPIFSGVVDSVLQSLFAAEAYGITKDTAYQFPETHVFGPAHKDMFRRAIAVNGNFEEIFNTNLPEYAPRKGLNRINDGSTGIMYSLPFGALHTTRRDLTIAPLGPLMSQILDRGILKCAIHTGRFGFAEIDFSAQGFDDDILIDSEMSETAATYVGMDVDFCKAVAASLFDGDVDAVEYISIQDIAEGYQMLASGGVDVVAGATWNLECDIHEPTTGMGFAFSTPYYYGYDDTHDNFCLATRQDDHDWSSYVGMVVSATIMAEEESISRERSNLMPEVFLFGEPLNRMLRNAIVAVGNYAEIYERNVAVHSPRGGRNDLNANPTPNPQHYIRPGFL